MGDHDVKHSSISQHRETCVCVCVCVCLGLHMLTCCLYCIFIMCMSAPESCFTVSAVLCFYY